MSKSEPTGVAARLLDAHGVLGVVGWGVVMPLGAMLIRLLPFSKAWIIHSLVMLFGLFLFTAAFGIGLQETLAKGYKITAAHTVMGTIVFAIAWTQPISGLIHHYVLKKHDIKTISSTLHVFLGRLLILTGIINGGLGLQLRGNSSKAENIAYGTITGIIYVVYLLASLWFEARIETVAVKTLQGEKQPSAYDGNLVAYNMAHAGLRHSHSTDRTHTTGAWREAKN